jgi:allophanate hydrolase subunit 2
MITLVRAAGLVTVQDLGRPGRMHEAIPPGGALIPSLLIAANRRLGNDDNAPAFEVFGRAVLRTDAALSVSTDVATHELSPGAELVVASDRHRAAYLAISGGIDVPPFLGGRGALVSAALGPILRPGASVKPSEKSLPFPRRSLRTSVPDTAPVAAREREPDQVRVIAGPDIGAFERFGKGSEWRVRPDSDRVGTRLAGQAIVRRPGFVERSRPTVKGAIEVPADGQPIVLGPEHPTTGGYPIVGVIASEDLDRFFAVPLGSSVRLVFSE